MSNCRYWCKDCGRKQVYCHKSYKNGCTWICKICGFTFVGFKKDLLNLELLDIKLRSLTKARLELEGELKK